MTAIFQFKSKSQLSAEANLASLIALARDKVKLWNNLESFNWDSPKWPTHYENVRFLKLKERGLHHSKDPAPHHLMASPFIDFAKAYLRYDQQKKQTQTFRRTIQALQLLEAALVELEGHADITKVSNRHLDRAVELLQKEGFKDRGGIAQTLKRLARDLSQWHIAVSNIKYWKHPFATSESKLKVSKLDPGSALNKLPEDDALLALAEVFANGHTEAQDDEDVFITSTTAMLLSAPMRISEMLYFRVDLLRTEKDALGNEQLYISYWVPKNGKYVRKEIPGIMADHAREAVRRLTKITEKSRNLAKYLESGSDRFFRHKDCPDVPDDQELTRDQVAKALGYKNANSIVAWVRKHTGLNSLTGWTLNSLWQLVLADHREKNPHFPYQVDPSSSTVGKPLKVSESLMCFRYQQLSKKYYTSPVLLAPMNKDFFAKRLDNRTMRRGNKHVNRSFFLKHGYDGFALRSHQLRHFLNTIAQEAGVGIDAITEWSTRASKEQSRIYMHQSPERKAQLIADKLNLTTRETMNPVAEDEYEVMNFGPIITTRYGICVHDYTLTPCNKHSDCLNCSELLMCKGHKKSIAAIQQERDRVAENLATVELKIEAGERVASRWHQAHSKMLFRLDQLLRVLVDPKIKDGSTIQMKSKDFSHESRIMDKIEKTNRLDSNTGRLSFSYSDDIAECFKLLQEEKNG